MIFRRREIREITQEEAEIEYRERLRRTAEFVKKANTKCARCDELYYYHDVVSSSCLLFLEPEEGSS